MNSNFINRKIELGLWVDNDFLKHCEIKGNEYTLYFGKVNYFLIGDNYICGYWNLNHLDPNNKYVYRNNDYVLCEYSRDWHIKQSSLTKDNLIIKLIKDF